MAVQAVGNSVCASMPAVVDVEATLTAAVPLLARVATTDATQTALLFVLQGHLFKIKAPKPVTLAAFQILYSAKVVSARAIVNWRDDNKDKTRTIVCFAARRRFLVYNYSWAL